MLENIKFFQSHSLPLLSRSFEAAAMCQKELKDWKKSGEYIEQACELFLEHGTPDTAGIVLDKGAK